MTFAFVSWLFASALVIIAAAVIGAEASGSPPAAGAEGAKPSSL